MKKTSASITTEADHSWQGAEFLSAPWKRRLAAVSLVALLLKLCLAWFSPGT